MDSLASQERQLILGLCVRSESAGLDYHQADQTRIFPLPSWGHWSGTAGTFRAGDQGEPGSWRPTGREGWGQRVTSHSPRTCGGRGSAWRRRDRYPARRRAGFAPGGPAVIPRRAAPPAYPGRVSRERPRRPRRPRPRAAAAPRRTPRAPRCPRPAKPRAHSPSDNSASSSGLGARRPMLAGRE